MQIKLNPPPAASEDRSAFTLVEMLIAMAVTLLMMAAIARGFAFVGERVKDSRGNLQLSADSSDITTRLRDELSRCTVDLTPNTGGPDQAGYFLYYDGPITDVTSSIFAAEDVPENPTPLSRYGDFDDYLAFTAVASPGTWFTGKVPRYLLDRRSVERLAVNRDADTSKHIAYDPVDFPGNPWDPIVIRSRYAEIIYFSSPEYSEFVPTPIFADAETDGLPDRIRLHRRVLLIRPDLNLEATGQLPIRPMSDALFMQADAWPTATNTTVQSSANVNDGWLYGMAGVHQQCDLSIRRVLASTGNVGEPTNNVAANSLADLAKPHNRFAHVRAPLGGGLGNPTSMPVLALGERVSVLNRMTDGGSSVRISPPNTGTVITPDGLSGFLRPEFILGSDKSHLKIASQAWGSHRLGEDVVINNLLSFDVKIYDPSVRSFTSPSGLVVGPNDAGYREALTTAVADPAASTARGELLGGFVDLMYPVLAGGALRGGIGPLDRITTDPSPVGLPIDFVVTPYSGLSTSNTTGASRYSNSLYRSGRIVNNGTSFRIFQPAFDTYTSYFEHDGIRQSRASAANEGTLWRGTTGTDIDRGSDGLDSLGLYAGGQATADRRFSADDLGEHETQPPFLTPAEAIQVSVRLYNPSTRQIKQLSVIHRGKR